MSGFESKTLYPNLFYKVSSYFLTKVTRSYLKIYVNILNTLKNYNTNFTFNFMLWVFYTELNFTFQRKTSIFLYISMRNAF